MNDDAARGVVVRFKVIHQADGRFHWVVNPHGTPMGHSMATFDTEDEAFSNAEYARRLISQAPITRS
jgi:hypothetical protein